MTAYKKPQEQNTERDIRLLGDIIALILDKEDGEAVNALAHLRTRAQDSKITGGALKNLFFQMVKHHQIKDTLSSDETMKAHKNTLQREEEFKKRIKTLRDKQYGLQNYIRNLENKIERLHEDNASFHHVGSYQKMTAIIAVILGILIGITISHII